MPGRGSQTFQKRQKEQQRKERQQEKFAKRLAAKNAPPAQEQDEENLTREEGKSDLEINSEHSPVDGLN